MRPFCEFRHLGEQIRLAIVILQEVVLSVRSIAHV